jgi:hypothetical protein
MSTRDDRFSETNQISDYKLFKRLMSAYGLSVWTGRALQAESDDLEKVGLALLYPAY